MVSGASASGGSTFFFSFRFSIFTFFKIQNYYASLILDILYMKPLSTEYLNLTFFYFLFQQIGAEFWVNCENYDKSNKTGAQVKIHQP